MAEEIKYRNLGAFSSAGGFNVANADPIDSRQLVADISHIFMDGNWAEVKPYPGLIVSAPSGEARIYVGREWSTANQHTDWKLETSWKKIGSGSVAVDTYSEAIAMATADTIGQVIYVKTKSTHNEAEYEAAPYIVIAAGSLQKLAASTAGSNIANDLAALTTRVGTAEGEIDALQIAVGDANSGLVKGLADANGAIDAVEGRMDTAEGEIDALQGVVGNADSGLVKNVAALQTLTGEHAATLTTYGSRIGANETAVAELRGAVAGGTHFKGVYPELPALTWDDVEGIVTGTWKASGDEETSAEFIEGDIIIVDGDRMPEDIVEPTSEYILVVEEGSGPKWVFLGNCAASDQKIAKVEKDFNDHVKAMETAWSEHLEEADTKYALATGLQAAEKALEDHVTAMAPTVEAATDYVANKSTFALAANVVANDTFNQHVTDADTRMDGIDAAILAVPVKSVTTDSVLKLSEAGALSVDMSNFVTKDGNKGLSTNDFTNDLKTKLDNIAPYAQVNVIEEVKVNGTALSVNDKAVNIDLSAYALTADVVAKTTTVNGQSLSSDIILDAADIATTKVIGDMTAGTTVENAIDTLHSKIGNVSTVANSALQTVVGSSAISVANKNNISLVVKSGSALTVGTDGLDLVWTEL